MAVRQTNNYGCVDTSTGTARLVPKMPHKLGLLERSRIRIYSTVQHTNVERLLRRSTERGCFMSNFQPLRLAGDAYFIIRVRPERCGVQMVPMYPDDFLATLLRKVHRLLRSMTVN
jgi:hypothetical protein